MSTFEPGERVVRISEHHEMGTFSTFDNESRQYEQATVVDPVPLYTDRVRVQWDKGNHSVINANCLQKAPPLIEEDPI